MGGELPSTAKYAPFLFAIWDKILDLLRSDPLIIQYQFKSVLLVGDDFIPEVHETPCIRLIPDTDNILQSATNVREHGLNCGVFIYDYKPKTHGEEAFRDHVTIVGRVYDVIMAHRSLDEVNVMDCTVEQADTKYAFADNGMNFISLLRVLVKMEKQE